ncbi:MAG: sugar ABC transporter permease [Sphaerochaetaceae bacterium]|jgi:raffinose/stachyose/melibiose transport system permease protein|nr:sugar ABC transporter permease [Sphaerochaetaceae bacterium]MDX9809007.1 sugar ABC transporter permease [Sphaerochaetaceae bacterium]NLV85243.1 sugar ABC transporter permease [Spirochaetales bacterium]
MKSGIAKGRGRVIALFIIPGLLVYAILVLYPLIQGFALSTERWVTVVKRNPVGLDNYRRLFNNSLFWNSLKVTLQFMVGTTFLQVVVGFFLGYFLYKQMKGYRFYKTLYFIPVVLMTVAVGFIWNNILSPSFGLLKPFMNAIGLGELYFPPLADPKLSLLTLILTEAWRVVGIQVMMFYAGFMNMPQDVLEMATIDGASGIKLIWHMVIPLVWDIAKMVIILQLTGSLRAFDLVYVMTKGGPNHATELLPMHMFVHAFENFNIGIGSAVAVCIFILSMFFTVLLRVLMKRESLQ